MSDAVEAVNPTTEAGTTVGGRRASGLAAAGTPIRKSPSVWRRFRRHRLAMVGLTVLVVLAFTAVFAPLLTKYPPTEINLKAYRLSPSLDHPLEIGRAHV